MVSRSRLSGVYAAVVTPFDRGQRVDLNWMTQHITFVRRAGIHGIVVCGTNGEGQWLSAAERRAIVEHVSIHKKSLRLIAGAGFNSLTETAGFAAFCDDYPVDALLIPPPCFDHAASGAGIVNFYRFVAERTSTPIVLYNIPQLTGLPITHEMLRELAKVNNIRGVKDSTGDPASTRAFISAFPRLAVFTGHDDCSLQGLRDGAAGMISGLANVFPSQVMDVWNAFSRGGGDREQQFVSALREALQGFPQRAASKYALHLCGMPETRVRPPEVELTPEQKARLTARLCG